VHRSRTGQRAAWAARRFSLPARSCIRRTNMKAHSTMKKHTKNVPVRTTVKAGLAL